MGSRVMRRLATRALLLVVLLVGSAAALAQGRAWRDLAFGDSPDVVAAKLRAYEDVQLSWLCAPLSSSRPAPEASVEEVKACFHPPWGGFHVDFTDPIGQRSYMLELAFSGAGLYQLEIQGGANTATYFDSVTLVARDFLVGLIAPSRGEPDRVYNVRFIDLRSGFVHWSHVWEADPDGNAYRVGLGERSSEFYPVLVIEWAEEAERVRAADLDQERDETKRQADDF